MDRRVFTVHDRQYYLTKTEMTRELGIPAEDVETVWESGSRVSPCSDCPLNGNACVTCDDNPRSTTTHLPYDVLEELSDYIERKENDYYQYGTYPTKEEGMHFERFKSFIKHLRDLWFQCAGCDRMVNPDEQRYQDPATDTWYCMECLNEGI